MRRQLLLFSILFIFITCIHARSFVSNGINYNIISAVSPYSVSVSSGVSYTGDIVIPTTVSHSDTLFSVTSINTNAFNGSSSLTSISIPNSVSTIGLGAFYGCTGLRSINLDPTNQYFIFIDGILYNASHSQLIYCLTNITGKIEIPETVTTIGSAAFNGCNGITSVSIPNSVTSVGSQSFYNCTNLATIVIGDSTNTGVKAGISIQSNAFTGCVGLTTLSLNLPIALYNSPFQNLPSLTTLFIGNSVPIIDNYIFSNLTGLTKITLGRTNLAPTKILVYPGAFNNSLNLETLNINSNLHIQSYSYSTGTVSPFSYITTLSIGNKVDSIGSYAFAGCTRLKSTVVPNTVKSIGQSAFAGCTNMGAISLGSSVSEIAPGVFTGCSSLLNINVDNANVTYSSIDGVLYSKNQLTLIQYPIGRSGDYAIPTSVKTIGTSAFLSCVGLQSVQIPQAIISIQSSAFANSGLTLVSIGDADSISTATVSIASDAFIGCKGITKLRLNKNFTFSSGNSPFQNLSLVTEILIGNGIISIPSNSFAGCTGLRSVRLGHNNSTSNNTITVSASAFSGCTNFAILELNKSINVTGYASPFTSISSLAVGNGVVFIGSQAFSKCINIESVMLPLSVHKIGGAAFQDCSKLQSATFSGVDSIGEGSFWGCSALASIVIPNRVKTIEYATFYGCTALVSASLGDSITQIKNNAFYGCSLLSTIIIPNATKVIDTYAFYNCSSMTSVAFGTSLSSISTYAFSGCSSLLSIQFPSSLNSIEDHAFENCKGLTSLFIPSTMRSVGTNTFSNCSGITTITIGDANNPGMPLSFDIFTFTGCTGVKTLIQNKDVVNNSSYCPFMGFTALENVTISNYVSHLNDFAFYGCSKITTLTIPNSVKSIGASAFYNCSSLTSIKLPDNIQSISNSLFWGCSKLQNLTIPSSVVVIGNYAFYECSSLTSLTIPQSVIAVGGVALSGCTGLNELIAANPNPAVLGMMCFDRVATSTCKLYVPIGSKVTYQSTKQWTDFANIIETKIKDSIQTPDLTVYPDPITGITKTVTIDAGGLQSALTTNELATINKLSIVGTINASDFLTIRDYMPALTILDLNNATIIDYTGTMGTDGNDIISYPANGVPVNAFYNQNTYKGKTSLVSIILPKTVTSIGDNAFKNCGGLTGAVPLPPLVTFIGNNAYQSCTQFNGMLNIPSSVTFIGEGAFAECDGLNSITIPYGITSIEHATFYRCNRLITINIPSSVTAIKTSAFYECGQLISLTIPSSVTTIGNNAFVNCGLVSVTLPPSITTIEDYTFTECHALQSIIIPEGVKSIGSDVFLNCYSLTNISLPSSLTSIGYETFLNCRNLISIYAYPITPIVLTDYSTFYSANKSTCILYVPSGSLNAYQEADQWKDFLNIREMGVTDVNPQISNSISFYPNPVTDGFHVNGLTEPSLLTLTDLNGTVLLTKQITGNEYISISAFPQGLYIVKLITSESVIEKKIIKI